jgi:hypothetical protein
MVSKVRAFLVFVLCGRDVSRRVRWRAYFALFFRRYRHPGLRAQLCEGGSSCGSIAKVHRPDKKTMRVRLDEFVGYGPGPGSSFRGVSFAYPMGHRTRIDRTRWGIVT